MYIETLKYANKESYRTYITINNKKIKSPSFDRKHDCKNWYNEQLANRNKIKVYGAESKFYSKKVFNNYCDDWLLTKKAQDVSRSTLSNYESNIRVHFKPFFVNKDLRSISKSDIERLQIKLKEHHNSKGLNVIITVLKAIFKEAVKEGYILKTPCEYIKSLTEEQRPDVFWSREELVKFLQANHQHELYDLFLVAMNTGLRKGELAGLKWDRVLIDRKLLGITRIRDRVEQKERTKTNLIRWVPMNDIVITTLVRLKNKNSHSDFVFLNEGGQPINTHHLYRTFQRAQIKAGVKNIIRFHDLRHTFASNFIMDGGKSEYLQKFLGHTELTMTQRYTHFSDESLQQAMAGFSLGMVKQEQVEDVNEISNVVDMRDHKKLEDTQNLPRQSEI